LGAALGRMVCGLTENRNKYSKNAARVKELRSKFIEAQAVLQQLVREDAEAYQRLMDAYKLPHETEQQKALRAEAIECTTREAAEVPLKTARIAAQAMEWIQALMQIGNPHAKSDAAVGAQLTFAALKGAQYNVLTNGAGLKDRIYADNCRREADTCAENGYRVLRIIDTMMTAS
jgi:glutamate formiminotransferase/formiminotetrahydrofolate cyclodeaminase